MQNIRQFLIILFLGEMIAFIIFKFIEFLLEKTWGFRINRAVIKGVLERSFLFLALIYNLPQALIAFGALKIGTRVGDDSNKVSLDYFFIGNITSLLIIILYFVVWKALT